VKQGAAEPTD